MLKCRGLPVFDLLQSSGIILFLSLYAIFRSQVFQQTRVAITRNFSCWSNGTVSSQSKVVSCFHTMP